MKLGLGTVQFGLDYGVSNAAGRTNVDEAEAIIAHAAARGVRFIDTARQYGESEQILGRLLKLRHGFDIVTKTEAIRRPNIVVADCDAIERGFMESLERMGQSSVYGLMVHHADDLAATGADMLFSVLKRFKEQKLVRKVGVSAYREQQISVLPARYDIDIVQVPVNVFDQRLLRSGLLARLKARGIEIHARSAFLQGAVFMDPDDFPLPELRPRLAAFRAAIAEMDLSPAAVALSFVLTRPEVDCVVCGVNTASQFAALCDIAANPAVLPPDFFKQFAIDDDKLVNPSNWQV